MAIKYKTRSAARLQRHKRIRKKVSGTPERPRLTVFRSLNQIYVQVIDDEAGHTITSASTIDSEVKEKAIGLNRTEQARLVGETIADRTKDKGIHVVTFDRGGYRYIGRVKALADGARNNGLEF
jgi:large subunit ribosomal protein L18